MLFTREPSQGQQRNYEMDMLTEIKCSNRGKETVRSATPFRHRLVNASQRFLVLLQHYVLFHEAIAMKRDLSSLVLERAEVLCYIQWGEGRGAKPKKI